MAGGAVAALEELARLRGEFGDQAAARKRALLSRLERGGLSTAEQVLTLHEVLCFLRAYPDDAALLEQVERLLGSFDRRRDLRRHRRALESTGIAGTETYFRFFAPTALWLSRRWPAHLELDWPECENTGSLEAWLPLLASYAETPAIDEFGFELKEWIERLKGPEETGAAFLLRRMEQIPMDPALREMLLDQLDLAYTLTPGPETPARTRESFPAGRIAFQAAPLKRERPRLPAALEEPPRRVRRLSPAEGKSVLELARSAMVVRSRDLDAFSYGDARDVRLAELGDGFWIALVGMLPARRLMLETQYGFLVLRNHVPLGYGTITTLFRSSEVAFTIFDTFRSAEAASIFAGALRVSHHVFGADTFMIDPYQIGRDNEDAVQSGAWWFYRKLGFAPRDRDTRRLMREEERRMKADRSHRSSPATLRALAEAPVFYSAGAARDDVLGVLPLARIGLEVSAFVSRRFGHDRKRAERVCAAEARRLLGVRRRPNPAQRMAWERWGPLVLALSGIGRWSAANRRALATIIDAKAGPRESDYLARFDAHRALRRALVRLASSTR